MFRVLFAIAVLAVWMSFIHVHGKGEFQWMGYDKFDLLNEKFSTVDGKNCISKSKDQLTLPTDAVSQLPYYNELLTRVWYRNRTALIHLHNMALNRAFFFSYVLQLKNSSDTYFKQPNWLYYYFSNIADVNANPNMINGSAVYFDNHCHYPNWFVTVPFNRTLPLFGPRTWRHDNYKDQGNILREPTRTVVKTVDAGAGRVTNYTNEGHKMNPWYSSWLPDVTGDKDSLTKFTYYIGIKMSNVTGQFNTDEYESFAFFGPSSPSAKESDPRSLPVQFTQPYFDCGGSNKWVVSAVSPVIDFMPRYSNYTHLRRQRVVGVIVKDIDFREVDFNACDVGKGNPGPSHLSGIHRCQRTTSCKHRNGFGFQRGGYVCVCKAGTHWPWYVNPPFLGEDIEQATEREYKESFKCQPTDYRLALPIVDTSNGLTVEGGAIPINSGGVDIDNLQRGRKKRSASNGNKTENGRSLLFKKRGEILRSGNRKKLKEPQQGSGERSVLVDQMRHDAARASGVKVTPREYTTKDIMELVEKLTIINENNCLKSKNGSLTKKEMERFRSIRDDYAEKNNVDTDIETDYENDLIAHTEYSEALIQEHREKNLTHLTVDALKESVIQLRSRHIERFHQQLKRPEGARSRKKRAAVFDQQSLDRMLRILRQKESVTARTCHHMPTHLLELPGDVGYGASTQFEPEGRTALRLSNFLSIYLQNVMSTENFGNLRGGGILHADLLFGEVLANVMGNFKIASAGLYFDRYKFENQDSSVRELFGPWAYRTRGSYFAMDTAGLRDSYLATDWFMRAKARFSTNFSGLKKYKSRTFVRSDPEGTSSIRHEYFPIVYKAAPYELGFWTRPFFRCDGNVDTWVMTYVAPFFGLDGLRTKLEFRGVATVDVPLNFLEINQCPQPFSVANAFKNTARCDYLSTNCAPQAGFPFMRGSYTCKCRLGFEYWHYDGKEWFEGSFVELEYVKKQNGNFSRFDHLYCRPASASNLQVSWVLTVTFMLTTPYLWTL
ncbi:uncharacterized protein LOC101864077 [Aplysia californica]|uniref:Uncharacterized protein LOC101864077 n=1 Tax=Aplysia californica TaxID=6500 RepID=A0ABM1A497_APLCA|nr:uncharacterized protein LOC101864077 [Aplysia californica]